MAKPLLVADNISSRIYTVRGVQAMLDEDLAILYGTSTMRLNQAVKRNISRFPEEFCFRLTRNEYSNLISQIVISNYGGRRKLPYVFTEQGVAMLSGVLKSDIAIHMSIQIMTAFVSMRKVIRSNAEIYSRLDRVEQKQIEQTLETDKKFNQVFDALSSKDKIPDQKIFFDGQVFDARKFVSDLIRSAKSEIILIDNFIDDTTLNLFSKRKKDVTVTIYTKSISPELASDIKKYNEQYVAIVVKEINNVHDRFLIIDAKSTYHFGASIKDLGKKLFAVSRLDKQALSLLHKLPTA